MDSVKTVRFIYLSFEEMINITDSLQQKDNFEKAITDIFDKQSPSNSLGSWPSLDTILRFPNDLTHSDAEKIRSYRYKYYSSQLYLTKEEINTLIYPKHEPNPKKRKF